MEFYRTINSEALRFWRSSDQARIAARIVVQVKFDRSTSPHREDAAIRKVELVI